MKADLTNPMDKTFMHTKLQLCLVFCERDNCTATRFFLITCNLLFLPMTSMYIVQKLYRVCLETIYEFINCHCAATLRGMVPYLQLSVKE